MVHVAHVGTYGTTSIKLSRPIILSYLYQITQLCHIFGLFLRCLHTYVRCLLPCCSLLPGTQCAGHGQSTTRGIPGDRQSRRQKPEVACNWSDHTHTHTPTSCLVSLSLQYITIWHEGNWRQSCSIIQQPWSQVWQHPSPCFFMLCSSAVTYAQVSAYRTVKFLPSSLLWPIVKVLGSKKPFPGMQYNTLLQSTSVLYVAVRFTALKCKLCFDRARYRKGHQAVGATWRIRYWNSLKQWQLMEWSPHGVWGSLGPLLLAIFECLPWSPEGHVEVRTKSQAHAVLTNYIQMPFKLYPHNQIAD